MIFQDKASALNIIGIYSTNAFKMGVGIQTARFNHSCCSNAEAIWDDEDKTRNTRAVSKITAGEEININYHWEGLSMRNLKTRQSLLHGKWGFKCCCDICKEEEVTPDDEKYELFEKLNSEIKNCMQNQQRQDRMARLETIKKELVCHKEMYKLAKNKKAPRTFIVNEILDDGFNAAVQGYLSAESALNQKFMEEFQKECEIFATAGEQLSKVLSKKTVREWNLRKHSFEDWMKDVKEEMKDIQQLKSNCTMLQNSEKQ